MKLKNRKVVLKGKDGDIHVRRNQYGIPEIQAQSLADCAYGLGWVHACDRQLQMMLTRILLQGRAAEHLKGDPELIEIDTYMRRMNFLPDPDGEMDKLKPDIRRQLQSYADGCNLYLSENRPILEFRLLGYDPEPWEIKDTLLIAKVFGFIGLAEAQGNMEKFLVQMIQNGCEEEKLRELFPYLVEDINHDLIQKITLTPPLVPEVLQWIGKAPLFSASNNWTVSGTRTESGKPILCGDPHLEVNRLPSVWQEIVMSVPGNRLIGVSVPGAPGLILGRTDFIAWSATYGFMDVLDYRIERCKDGKYHRRDGWRDFRRRRETIVVKKGRPVIIDVYENEHGLLEGDPGREGHYLVLGWSAKEGCGAMDMDAVLNLPGARTAREAMELFKQVDASPMNWVVADRDGNIGYQMSGRLFNRPEGVSGLLPLPGWEERYDHDGFVDKDLLPTEYNPEEGIIATANQDLNYLGRSTPINLPMGKYRAERIKDRLREGGTLNVDYMKSMHFDLYSLQAEQFMERIRPLLPDTENGNILRDWHLRYETDSKGAMLFESVYRALIATVFGDHGFGRAVVDYVLRETSLFNDYYENFDTILLKETSPWFEGMTREEIYRQAIDEGLNVEALRYGETRRIMLSHLLFGGKLPRFLGYDYGPIELPGSSATIPQGQIFRSAGRLTTFCPSYRFIADLGSKGIHTTLAGGPSDRRFSKWYVSDVKNWLDGIYKELQ
ncbi:MAG: penicillin acylase family protein [Deltaproteobacteria bacterium]|nr:penicillin acylase family protein [Deltaproteobacteria bacterium]